MFWSHREDKQKQLIWIKIDEIVALHNKNGQCIFYFPTQNITKLAMAGSG